MANDIPDPTTTPSGIAGILYWGCNGFSSTVKVFVEYPFQAFMVCALSFIFVIVGIGGYNVHAFLQNERTSSPKHQTAEVRASQDATIRVNMNRAKTLTEVLRRETNADRAVVFLFHNGKNTLMGRSMRHYSNIIEKVAAGVEQQLPQLQDVPRSFLPDHWLSAMERESLIADCVGRSNSEDDHTEYLKGMGLHAVAVKFFYHPTTGEPLGFVGIGRIHHEEGFLTRENYEILERKTEAIGELIR